MYYTIIFIMLLTSKSHFWDTWLLKTSKHYNHDHHKTVSYFLRKKSSHAWLLLKIHELHKNANKINEDLSCCRPNCQALCWQPTFNEVYHDQIIVIVIELLYKFSWWFYFQKAHLWKFMLFMILICWYMTQP